MPYERVWTNGGNAVWPQDGLRKIFWIDGDNFLRTGVNCCGEHLPIIGIWKTRSSSLQRLEAGDDAVGHGHFLRRATCSSRARGSSGRSRKRPFIHSC